MKSDVRSGNLMQIQAVIRDGFRFLLQPVHILSFPKLHCNGQLGITIGAIALLSRMDPYRIPL